MKTIFRTQQMKNFTTLPNDMLRRTDLSWGARGMLASILTHTEEWNVNRDWLNQQSSKDGLQRTRNMMHELESAGYAVCYRYRNPETKAITRAVWTFHDAPVPEKDRSHVTEKHSL